MVNYFGFVWNGEQGTCHDPNPSEYRLVVCGSDERAKDLFLRSLDKKYRTAANFNGPEMFDFDHNNFGKGALYRLKTSFSLDKILNFDDKKEGAIDLSDFDTEAAEPAEEPSSRLCQAICTEPEKTIDHKVLF